MPDICCRSCLGCWRLLWSGSLPQWSDSKFFAVDNPSYRLDLQYWYQWNVQVLTNIMVQVPFVLCCMVLEIQLFFMLLWGPSSRKHGATTLWIAWIKNNKKLLYDHWGRDPLNISLTPFSTQVAATTTNIRCAAAGSCSFLMMKKNPAAKYFKGGTGKRRPKIHDT